MNLPPIVDDASWRRKRDALLEAEKAHMRASDALAARRRRLPMVAFDGEHRFAGPDGEHTLRELFDGRRQLITYHFMLPEGGSPCSGCSMVLDQLPHLAHLHARDTSLVVTSYAPQSEVQAVKTRLGWDIPWVTVLDRGYTRALGITTGFGLDVFLADGDEVYRTNEVRKRGVESLGTVWDLLDLTPLGRQESWEDSPEGRPQTEPYRWWRLHDRY